MKKSPNKPLFTHVRPSYYAALKAIDEQLSFNNRQIIEDALSLMFGAPDPVAQTRQKVIQEAFEKGKVKRPFNQPWPPLMAMP